MEWGVLTFFLSFIPYLGIFVATIPSVLLAWAQYGLGMAVVVILDVSIINFLSMPLTIMVMLLLDSFDETRWAAKLMVARGQQVTAVSKAE